MADGTIGVQQQPPTDACPFDLYVWVPAALRQAASADDDGECDGALGVAAGSTLMDGRGGVTQRSIACAVDLPGLPPPRTPPQPPSPAPSPPPPPAPPVPLPARARRRSPRVPRDRAAPRRGGAHHHLGARARHLLLLRRLRVVRAVRWEAEGEDDWPAELVNSLDAQGRPVVRAANKDDLRLNLGKAGGNTTPPQACARSAPQHERARPVLSAQGTQCPCVWRAASPQNFRLAPAATAPPTRRRREGRLFRGRSGTIAERAAKCRFRFSGFEYGPAIGAHLEPTRTVCGGVKTRNLSSKHALHPPTSAPASRVPSDTRSTVQQRPIASATTPLVTHHEGLPRR